VINPETIRVLGWCLLHFIWQGAVLALILSVALTRLRSPRARYGAAVCVLAAMMIAPCLTFAALQPSATLQPFATSEVTQTQHAVPTVPAAAASSSADRLLPFVSPPASTDWLSYAVLAWLAGVYMFTLRTLGAWMLLMRLRRQRAESIGGDLLETCLALQRRLGVSRAVRYVCSKAVEAPAVLGWLRPVVVLPLSALAGLTPWQVEAIIAHELAHIKRWDALVNVFQIAIETLLFYHPAVWWVNRVIRNEREHCCDDVAVEACGNAPGYARALALLEESRCASVWALAANGGVLSARIGRLLGIKRATRSMSGPGFAVLASLCVAGALMAGTASTQVFSDAPEPAHSHLAAIAPLDAMPAVPIVPPVSAALPRAPQVVAPAVPAVPVAPAAPPAPAAPEPMHMSMHMSMHMHLARLAAADPASAHRAHEANAAKPASGEGGSYIGGLQAAGLKDLTVDEIIALKIHEVTPEYIQGLRAAGLQANSSELVSLKIHEVTPDYVRDLAAAGLTGLQVHDYLAARVQGITPEFVQKIRSHGFKDITLRQLISLKLADIT
jgi:beta-lactamase regulating signal transducer with metallopeptidase domain